MLGIRTPRDRLACPRLIPEPGTVLLAPGPPL